MKKFVFTAAFTAILAVMLSGCIPPPWWGPHGGGGHHHGDGGGWHGGGSNHRGHDHGGPRR